MNITRHLSIYAASLMAVAAISSCSDNDITDGNSAGITAAASQEKIALVDSLGNTLSSVSPSYGKYYLRIHTNGNWKLKCDDAFLALGDTTGCGDALVQVLVGENWNLARQGTIHLTTENDVVTRGESDSDEELQVSQLTAEDLEKVKQYLSSNRGAGYSYQFNDEYCLGTGVEVFNMRKLDSLQTDYKEHFIEDDFYPQVMQEVYSASTKDSVDTKLAIEASLGVDYNKVSVKVNGKYSSDEGKSENTEYSRLRLLGSQFTREINYLNCLAASLENEEKYKEIYSPGFRLLAQELEDSLKGYTLADSLTHNDAVCANFLKITGPCLITKALMGCALDYSMSFKSDDNHSNMTAAGALQLKLSFVSGSVDVDAKGEYNTEDAKYAQTQEATCQVRGGNVNLVNILATGGKFTYKEGETSPLVQWQLSVKPYNSVMINMNTAPIYAVLKDTHSRIIMGDYFNRILSK